MRVILNLFVLGIFFLYSCATGQREANNDLLETDSLQKADYDYLGELEKNLIGEWTNNMFRVQVNSYNNNKDTSFLVDINADNWELKMSIKPIVTTIRPDGTYVSEYRNFLDSLMYKPEGAWMLDGDSLIMEDEQNRVYKYQVFIDGKVAEFRSYMDWDGDGKKDDYYFGIQHKSD